MYLDHFERREIRAFAKVASQRNRLKQFWRQYKYYRTDYNMTPFRAAWESAFDCDLFW